MAKLYIQNKDGKYEIIDVGRASSTPVIVDWGGCTGKKLILDMDKLWENDGEPLKIECVNGKTQKINGQFIFDDEPLESATWD